MTSTSRRLCTNVQTPVFERLKSTADTVVTLARRQSDQHEALLIWIYLGRTDSHQFIYSKQGLEELAWDK